MQVLDAVSRFVGKYMALIVLALAALSLLFPPAALWVRTDWINGLLMLVMFGMGMTLKAEDFRGILRRPAPIALGCAAQFTVMPLLAFGLGSVFGLDDALLAGVILVGACPGGTASNVITYLSRGDVALSVGMTAVNTLLAPVLTPAITYLFLHTQVQVNVWSMFLSIVQVVIVPIVLGLAANRFLRRFTAAFARALPLISVGAICLIVMAVISHNAERILTAGPVILAVVALHNLLGYACGYGLGRLARLDTPRTRALSIEVGMQNSGLATSLAGTAFPDLAMATVPGAVFSVWHNLSGAVLAAVFRRTAGSGPEAQESSPNEASI